VDPQATVPVEVVGSDRGYGFTVKVYYDLELILEADGPADESMEKHLTLNEIIGPMESGSHVIKADITDAAGNSASHSVTITTNTVPVANDDAYSTNEDVSLNVPAPGVLENDNDADGDALTVIVSTPPANGVLVINPGGSFSYTPNPNYHGTDSFGYTITDGNGGTDTATVSLAINAVNDPPVANDDAYTTAEDIALNVPAPGLLGNDTDVDADTLTVTASTPPANGNLAINPDGSFSYTPNLNYNGTDSFTYTISDANGGSDTALVYLTIAPVNDPPVATNDTYTTDEDIALNVPAPGVLANDTDVDGDALTVIVNAATSPANGNLVVNSDGSLTYKPDDNYNGPDSFTYTVSDGKGGIDTSVVSIDVIAVNDPPVVSIDLVSQQVQYSDRIVTVTITATDIDSDTLTLTPSDLPGALTTSGGCTASGDGSNCSWVLDGQTLVGAGTYTVILAASDGEYAPSVSTELIVKQEDASAVFDDANPTSVRVGADGSDSGMFDLVVDVTETVPDLPAEQAAPGDIALAEVTMKLVPVGPGATIDATNCVPSNNIEGVQTVYCSFNTVPVETYTVEVIINGDYYSGSAENVLTVYDPSLGFTTGGGWFNWPGTTDKTNFGYTMKYGKNGKNVKGSLLLIRHLDDGQKYRIKSNAITGLAVGTASDDSGPFGWASFSGKSTYLEPGMPEPEGNHSFTAYVEDHDEPGSGADRFWITTRAKDGNTISAMSLPEPAPSNAESIQGGNIVAPH